MDGILAVTYRCNAKCAMCHIWKYPSDKGKEITADALSTLPQMVRLNITGGEPFIRGDLGGILDVVKKKAKRVVISSNGFLTQRTLQVMRNHRDVGVRISFDGLGETHDAIRGVKNAHRKSLDTLVGLKELGIKDLGIAVTISDRNAKDLVPLFELAEKYRVELATAVLHNAYYFRKEDNVIDGKAMVGEEIRKLKRAYLASPHPKNWFRAYFADGIIDHMKGKQRSMKCTMASDSFFVDPYGDVRPCNVMDLPFGNIKEKSFQEIWKSPEADEARKRVGCCQTNCWMIGSVGHLIRRSPWKPIGWIASHKLGNTG
jgi:MoaA/NifB/PqqE/SkfB family radical SAM enzyme